MKYRTIDQLVKARDEVGSIGALDFLIEYERARGNGWHLHPTDGASKVQGEPGGSPLVSVVMTAFNSARTIERSVRSVLEQTWTDLELIVVDDCSADETVSILRRLSAWDSRIRVLQCHENRGTYWAKNLGIVHARGKYVALHDSDDTSRPQRVERQLNALSGSRAVLCYTNCMRVDPDGNPVLNRGLYERLGYVTAMFKKSLIDTVGFFDSVRVAADDEFHNRVKTALGAEAVLHIEECHYIAPLDAGSLTGRNPVSMELSDESDPLSFLSDTRRDYVDSYKRWHRSGERLCMPFPLRERPFPAPMQICTEDFSCDEEVIGSIASIPARIEGLRRVVSYVLPQVDRLHVHLNNYGFVPSFLSNPKISVTRSEVTGDLRDNGKFIIADKVEGSFILTFDDDLIYPRYYVAYLCAKVLQYGRRAAVGLHGTRINRGFKRYHDRSSRNTYTFGAALNDDLPVHVVGTGTSCYHSDALRFGLAKAKSTGMVDLWFASECRSQGVPVVCVSRGARWVTEQKGLPSGSLYEEFLEEDTEQSELVRKAGFDSSQPLSLECR